MSLAVKSTALPKSAPHVKCPRFASLSATVSSVFCCSVVLVVSAFKWHVQITSADAYDADNSVRAVAIIVLLKRGIGFRLIVLRFFYKSKASPVVAFDCMADFFKA